MSLTSSMSFFSESIESSISKHDSQTNEDLIFNTSYNKNPGEGFSSSLILNFENELENKTKPLSKLVNITQIVSGTQNTKKVLLPIFYRKSISSDTLKNLFYLEKNTISNDSPYEDIENKKDDKNKVSKLNRATSTTFGSMHTQSNIDAEVNHDLFIEGGNFEYESEMKSSLHEGFGVKYKDEGNLIAYCYKCRKETVTVMKLEKNKGFKGIKDLLLCCCSSWNTGKKTFVCPICSEILLKTN
ncbi:hypothetical protein SteCoe_18116 [Stentor coeruleus]|uniref:LITAF domain-containing protein n=1 Tax=Stentor coeruleus TaxID=5963 RepID=A0A1R2BXB6_9CILI|nr:hypothetical protein SteCoe_18116 [Stentor coeruleus]